MSLPPIVSAAEWQRERDELLAEEKAATGAVDALAARRRRRPMVPFESSYVFEGTDGPTPLLDLFDQRRQLIVYHFMDLGPDHYCGGCASYTDNIPTASGVDRLRLDFNVLDLTPYGRQEEWEDSPPAWPQTVLG